MAVRNGQHRHRPIHPLLLLFAVFGGTSAWTVHLLGSYATSNYFCGNAFAVWMLHGLTLLAGSVAAVAAFMALATLRRMNAIAPRDRTIEEQRTQFLASGGVLLGLLGLMAILFGEIAVVIAGCSP